MNFRLIVLFILLSVSPISFAWNAVGHMVVADIAYDHLNPDTKKRVDALIKNNPDEEGLFDNFVKASVWADWVKGKDISVFNAWHYVDLNMNEQGRSIRPFIPKENVIWAIVKSQGILASKESTDAQKALFLRFLIHFVGDIHQPMHCVSRISKAHPKGDRGGNLFPIDTPTVDNLHAYWDQGLSLFIRPEHTYFLDEQQVHILSKQIQVEYPYAHFGKSMENRAVKIWAQEGFEIAGRMAYDLDPNTTPSSAYNDLAERLVKQRVALAGYRLAYMLNETFFATTSQ